MALTRRHQSLLMLLGTVVLMVVAGVLLFVSSRDDTQISTSKSDMRTQNTTESTKNVESSTSPKTGVFHGLAPKTGSGTVTITANSTGTYLVEFGNDFTVQDGPDLYIGFGNNGEIDTSTLFATLKATNGRQTYEVPEALNPTPYSQVFIYCKEYSVPFAVAELQ